MIIPQHMLSPEALHRVIEAFVTREGTDDTANMSSPATKVVQVRQQLDVGLQSSSTTRKPKVVRCNQATGAQSTSQRTHGVLPGAGPREGHDTPERMARVPVSLQDVLPLGVATRRGRGHTPPRHRRRSSGPPPAAAPPSEPRRQFSAARRKATGCQPPTEAELCGEPITLGSSRNGYCIRNTPCRTGSTHQASRHAVNAGCRCRWASAPSSMISPRARFTRMASSGSRASSRANTPQRRVRERGRDDQDPPPWSNTLSCAGVPIHSVGRRSLPPVDGVNLHPYGPHEPRMATPIPPNPKMPDPAGQHAVRRKLIERPRGQLAVLNKEPLCGCQDQGERIRHRFVERTAVCRDRERGRQVLQGIKSTPAV